MFRLSVALLCSLSLIACTSMRPLPTTDKADIRAAVKVGDAVSIDATNGKTYVLQLTAVDGEKLVGVGDNKKVTIRYGQIKSIEVKRRSVGRSIGLAAAIVAVAAITTLVVILAIFASGDCCESGGGDSDSGGSDSNSNSNS